MEVPEKIRQSVSGKIARKGRENAVNLRDDVFAGGRLLRPPNHRQAFKRFFLG
jgi:hypothetical protein